MATNFPGSQDSFTNPTSGSSLSSPSHADQHTNVNDAVEAIETALLDGAPLKIDDVNERVGIGTTSPARPLHVYDSTLDLPLRVESGDSRAGIEFFDNATTVNLDISAVGDSLRMRTNGSDRFTIDSSGNVGINDTTPSYTLDVNGDGRFVNNLYVNQTLVTDAIENDNGNQLTIEAGDAWDLKSNATGEYVWIAAEGGIMIVSSDSNSTNWADREQIRITAEGGIDNKLRIHGRIRTNVTGGYGSVETGGNVTWDGYSIDGRVVFMHDGGSNWGIYNDANDEWMIYGQLNGGVDIRYNNASKCKIVSGGVEVLGDLTVTGYVNSTNQLRSAGTYNSTTPATTQLVHVADANYQYRLWRSTSRRDAKTDIESITDENALALLDSRPVWFRSAMPHDDPNLSYYGFIAEELAEVDPRMCTWSAGRVLREGDELQEGERACTCNDNQEFVHTFDHEPECIQVTGVDYGRLTAHLTKIAQLQQATITDLTNRITLLETA